MSTELSRRRSWKLRFAVAAVLVAGSLAVLSPASASASVSCPNSNPIVNENNCTGPGTTAYQVGNYSDNIGAFATQGSFNLGQDVPLKIGVNVTGAPTDTLNIQVYRIGYYGNTGARLIPAASNASVTANNNYTCQAMNATTGEQSCANWQVTYTIPGSALPVSGIYEAKITDVSRGNIQNYVVFPVRNDSRASKMLFVLPDASYQAYNTWSGKSLYFDKNGGPNTVAGDGRAVAVSFDRPLDGGDQQRNRFFGPDASLVQWVEQQGYDVTYTDDIQTDSAPASLLGHKVIVVSGHSEYWSYATFHNMLAARDAGVSIASFSGNTAYWQTRYADNYRTLICYKTIQGPGTPNDPASLNSQGLVGPGDNPQLATTTRRDPGAPAGTPGAPPGGRIGPNDPENQLLGNMYVADNEDRQWPLTVPAADANGQFAGNRAWRNTGISQTLSSNLSTGFGSDITGWEWDQIPSASSPVYAHAASLEPAGVKQLSRTDTTDVNSSWLQDSGLARAATPPSGQPSNVSAVEYRAPSGAVVFSAGTNQWAYALGPNATIAQATYNVFSDMGVQPGTPDAVTVDSRPLAPWAALAVSPNPVHYGKPASFDGSGSAATSGATIVDYQIDYGTGTYTDLGSTATASFTYNNQGTYTVRLRVTDSNGNTDVTTRTLVVGGDPPPVSSFTVTPAKPIAGQQVALDGSGSTGPVNPIVDYKWDLNGSGQYATDTGSTPTTTTSFAAVGVYTVGLKVTDSKGGTATTTVAVDVVATGASSYPDAVHATPGVLHYYRLGESARPTIADSVGNANGTISAGTFGVPGAVQGDPNTAVSFAGAGADNGASDFGQVPVDLSGSPTITVEFWLKWTAYANDDSLAMEFTPNFNSNAGGFLIDPNSSFGQFAVAIGNGASRNVATFTRPSAGVWHHYALVLDPTQPGATEITPYVDGQPVTYTKWGYTGTGAGNFANSTLYLMSRGGTSLFGTGALDELAIYNSALDVQRIQDHFASYGTSARPVASLKISPSPAGLNKTVTFDASGSSYKNGSITKYEWDLTGSGTYSKTTTTPTITTSYSSQQTIKVGLRVTDSDFGTDYTTQTLFVGNSPPVASLKATPNPAITGQNINFDATGSSVPNGSITDVKWDLDGSGTYATDTGTALTTTHSFSAVGVHTVGLRLTSDGGNVTTTTIKVNVLDTGVSDYEDAVLNTAGVLHYYTLGESAGPTVADSAGKANGTITGGTFGLPGPVKGDPTTAVSFNGTTESGAIPLDLSGSQKLTVEFWLKWTSYSNNDALAMEFTPNFNGQPGGFLVDPNSSFGQFAVSLGYGASRNIATFPRPSAGAWHHYAFVLDTTQPGSTTITPYVDGQVVSYTNQGYNGAGAGNFANSTLYLMSRGGSSLFGNGTLGQVAIYNAALTANQVLDHYSSSGTNKPPVAKFTTSPTRAANGQKVTFDASGSTDPGSQIVDYQWDLDGSGRFATDTGTNPQLTTSFATPGTYNVSLRVIDANNSSATATHQLLVGDDPPTAAFASSPSPLALVGQQVSFDGSGSADTVGQITDYKWDLDGSGKFATDTGTTPTTTFTYSSAGSYNVSLRVTNDQGQTATIAHTVDVHAATYKSTVLGTAGLLSYWRLGDAPGSSTLADSSGTSNATNFGATLGAPGALFGDAGTSGVFNGLSNYASVSLDLSATSQVTVEFWLNWTGYSNNDALAMEFTPNTNNNPGGFLIDPNASNGTFGVSMGMGAGHNTAYFSRPSAGTWHHYAFVLDTTQAGPTEITPYVDGKAVTYSKDSSGTGAGAFAKSTLFMMSRDGTSLFGNGGLQEVAIYNKPLSAATIASHFAAGTP